MQRLQKTLVYTVCFGLLSSNAIFVSSVSSKAFVPHITEESVEAHSFDFSKELSGTPYWAPQMSLEQVQSVLKKRMKGPFSEHANALAWHIIKLCKETHLSPSFVLAVINTESHFKTNAISHAGAIGLMQLMPKTAAYLAKKREIEAFKKTNDLFNPFINVTLGIKYLAELRDRFTHSDLYIAAYNLGPTTVGRMVDTDKVDLRIIRFYIDRIEDHTASYSESASEVMVAQN